MREEARVNVMSMAVTLAAARGAALLEFLTGLVSCFATHDGIPRRRPRRLAPVDAGRHVDQVGEASAEGAQRRAADHETDRGDAAVNAGCLGPHPG